VRLSLIAVVVTAASWGCGAPTVPPNPPPQVLTAWVARATGLFDDAIEPASVALDVEHAAPPPERDPLLAERSRAGDAVLRVRVATFTSYRDGTGPRFELGLQVLETIVGTHTSPGTFSVRFSGDSPSTRIVRIVGDRLYGKSFVAFVRRFPGPDGRDELHFHLANDDDEVRAAILRAAHR
jgi:hypothetical protein